MSFILIIEDDLVIRDALANALIGDGHTIEAVSTCAEGYQQMDTAFDACILDVHLPDGSGFDFLSDFRRKKSIPVLILTVQGDEEDILKGFALGADDYMTKPFSLHVLRARLHSILRRSGKLSEADSFPLTHDLERGEIRDHNGPLELSPLEYRLLSLFLINRGCTLSRAQLLEKLWDCHGSFVEDNTLSVTVKRLREKIPQGTKIVTIRGIGYRLEAST